MTESDNKQDNEALEDYLAGDSEVSKRYREADDDAPSSSLDRNILQAAREAVSADETPTQRTRLLSWERPWTIAAVVALSATLVVSIQRETGFFAPDMGETVSEQAVDSPQDATGSALGEEALRERMPASMLADKDQAPSGPASAGSASAEGQPSATPAKSASSAQDSEESEKAQIVVTATGLRRQPEATDTLADDGSTSQNLAVSASPEPEAARGDDEFPGSERRQSDSPADLARSRNELAGFAAARADDVATDKQADEALAAIASQWQAGDEAEALKRLEEFRQKNPEFDEDRLREALPEPLLELAGIGLR